MRVRNSLVLFAAATLILAACGDDDDGDAAAPAGGLAAGSEAVPAAATTPTAPSAPAAPAMPRRVEVTMTELAFSPATLDVKVGETISFVFTNNGKLQHDAFLGDKAAQEHHEKEMRAMTDPNDHGGHEGGVTVPAGQTGALRHTFDKPGTLEIGCHEPGHYAAGMKLTINVT